MITLTLSGINKYFGVTPVLEDINLALATGRRLGIVGANGAGKTTLLKIITGELEHDGGSVSFNGPTQIGYLAQESLGEAAGTVWENTLSVFEHVFAMEARMRQLEHDMADAAQDEDRFARLCDEYARLTEAFEAANGYGYRSTILGVLKGLNFTDDQLHRNVSTLSGGQQSRLKLARLLIRRPDLLLLDEPTNHLDIDSATWLEQYLTTYPGTVIVVSHDRYFLDNVCDCIAEIAFHKLELYQGNYTQYMIQHEERKRLHQKAFELNQREVARQEEIIRRYKQYNTEKSLRKAHSREKMLAKLDRVDRPGQQDSIAFSFQTTRRTGNDVLLGENLAKSFGPVALFSGLDLHIRAGDRVGIVGRNGIGKTTLLRILTEQLQPDAGHFLWGSGVNVGYYDQKQQGLDPQKTVINEVWDAYPTLPLQQVRDTLAAFLFTQDDVEKHIGQLSGGERGRVALIKLLLGKHNVLLLDEPTNHLDTLSCQVLEDALLDFAGTLLFVTHDRYFINRIANRVLEMRDDGVTDYPGNWDAYIHHKALENRPSIEEDTTLTRTARKKQERLDREAEQERRERARRVRQLEGDITAAEDRLHTIEQLLSDPARLSDEQLAALPVEHEQVQQRIDTLLHQWEQASQNELDA